MHGDGRRLLYQWIHHPLREVDAIIQRQDCVEDFFQEQLLSHQVARLLDQVADLERLLTRVAIHRANPRDLLALQKTCSLLPHVREKLRGFSASTFQEIFHNWPDLEELKCQLQLYLVVDPPLRLGDRPTIRSESDEELRELRALFSDRRSWLEKYRERVQKETGLRTLKVEFNRISGFYLEVSRGQSHLMPSSFRRQQTLKNSERFTSSELKSFEEKILLAEEKILAIEERLFLQLKRKVLEFRESISTLARFLAQIDCFCALARLARERSYRRPLVDTSLVLQIEEGRHPVLEAVQEVPFVPNTLFLDPSKERQIGLITGPNMGGKSTYIRQVALLVILAQMGSFIPAGNAHIGVVDRIFTRVGARDDLARGRSTFMVEMYETAHILNNATPRSLIILDEIGRGTSTYDGLSIAWSLLEYLLQRADKSARTLFATHYRELTSLDQQFPQLINLHVRVREEGEEIQFLHRVAGGVSKGSYGIHVAQLAGFPPEVLKRAREILTFLERKSR